MPADAAQLEKARVVGGLTVRPHRQLGELTQAGPRPAHRNPSRSTWWPAREIVDANEGLLREHGVTATVEAGGAVTAVVDRGQVGRALRNVLTNAVGHSPRGGKVRIGLDAGPPISVRIADQGSGIDADDLPFIFERFYRADRSRGRVPGSASSDRRARARHRQRRPVEVESPDLRQPRSASVGPAVIRHHALWVTSTV